MVSQFVCREFVLFFSVMDEGGSVLFGRNLVDYLPKIFGGDDADTLSAPVTNDYTGVRSSFLSSPPSPLSVARNAIPLH